MRRLILKILVVAALSPCFALPQSAIQKEKAERAKAALNAGNYAEAASLYSELVKELPAVPGLKMNLGMAYYSGGRFNEAVKYLSLAVQGDPQLTQGWLLLGASLLETGRPEEAGKAIQKYLAVKPDEPAALQILGDSYLRTNQFSKAIDVLDQVARKTPDSPRAWFGLGRAYEGLAGVAFERLEKMAPESGYWFALIADSRVAQKQFSSAFYFYRKALEKKPAPRGLHVAISRIYRETGHADWAAEEEKKELEQGEPDCAKEPLVCDFLAGKLHEMLELARKLSTPEGYYWQAQACNMMAVASFSRLAELPPSVEAHELRAEINRNQGRHFEAVAELQKALQLSPDDPRLKKELALSLYLKRDYAAAKVLVNDLLKLDPNSGELNYLAGDMLLYDQKADQALPYLEKAVKFSPDIVGAHSALGRAYMDLGEAAKAIPHLKIGLPADEDGSLHFQLSRAYQRTGQEQLAKETLAKYQEITRLKQSEDKKLLEEIKITPP